MSQADGSALTSARASAGIEANTTLLVVDDQESARYVKSRILLRAGFQVLEATTGEEALRMVAEHRPALVVLDIRLPDIDGIAVCRAIKEDPSTADTMVLQVSAYYTSTEDQVHGFHSGADAYIPGDVAPGLLVAVVRALLRTRRAEQAARARQERLELVQALDRSQRQLRALTASLLAAHDEERRSIARELHDDFSQRLAFLEIALTNLRQRRGAWPRNWAISSARFQRCPTTCIMSATGCTRAFWKTWAWKLRWKDYAKNSSARTTSRSDTFPRATLNV
jgi:DNA-binding response OmpR family regulator